MATGPVKSQPLHNFALPFLKWGGKNQTNSNHRIRRVIGGESSSSPSPAADHSEPDSEADSKPQLRLGSRTARNRLSFSSSAKDEKSEEKPWNLRPRKGPSLQETDGAVGELPQPKSLRLRGITESNRVEKKEREREREREKEKEKKRFWIALSRDEIEEDIFIMTGSRPSRRPKKRLKNVQKQLDTVFPGLWLVGVTPDTYRVAESPAKR